MNRVNTICHTGHWSKLSWGKASRGLGYVGLCCRYDINLTTHKPPSQFHPLWVSHSYLFFPNEPSLSKTEIYEPRKEQWTFLVLKVQKRKIEGDILFVSHKDENGWPHHLPAPEDTAASVLHWFAHSLKDPLGAFLTSRISQERRRNLLTKRLPFEKTVFLLHFTRNNDSGSSGAFIFHRRNIHL